MLPEVVCMSTEILLGFSEYGKTWSRLYASWVG
jgi:hypothetical protein